MSSKVIRKEIADRIHQEDPLSHMSDEMLAEILRKHVVHIARRTVAKYREQMKIPVERLRKKSC